MSKNIANKVVRGTNGRLWINDELLANVKSFECKLTMNYEELDINGEPIKQNLYTSAKIAGTMVLHKINSKMLKYVSDAAKTMIMPDIYLVSKVTDPQIVGAERVKIGRVVLDEVALASFENAKAMEENIPFKGGSYETLDTIEEE